MNYQTHKPAEELSAFVKCYWTLEGQKEKRVERQKIVPDGCMEMIFHYGDLYKQYVGGSSIIQPRCFVIGQLTRPLEIEPTGSTGIFSVRFRPEGFAPLSTVPIKEMENTAVPLKRLFGEDGVLLGNRVLSVSNDQERIKIVERFLLIRLMDKNTVDRVVTSTMKTILELNGRLSVEELSGQAEINRRQLERKFSAHTGLSPKQLSRTIRLQAVLKRLIDKDFDDLTTLAYDGDYYDQAHFIKDFKEFTGLTPKAFYGEQLEMSALFYGKE